MLQFRGQAFPDESWIGGIERDAGCAIEGKFEQALDLTLGGQQFFELGHLAAFERSGHGELDRAADVLGTLPFAFLQLLEIVTGLGLERGGTAGLLVGLGKQHDDEQTPEQGEGELEVQFHVERSPSGRSWPFFR